MPTPKKEETVISLRDELEKSEGLVLFSFTGLSVPGATELRRTLRQADARMVVIKNRLLRLALAGSPAEALDEQLTGQNAVLFCYAEVPPAVKLLTDFAKDHEGIVFKGSVMEGSLLDGSQTGALASIPSKPELLGQVVGALNSPLAGLVYALQGLLSQFVYTLQAVADQRSEQPAA